MLNFAKTTRVQFRSTEDPTRKPGGTKAMKNVERGHRSTIGEVNDRMG